MALNYTTLQVGDVVRYSDMANPGSTYVITRLPERSPAGFMTDFRMVRVDDGSLEHHYSDCRQHGWTLLDV